MAEHGRWFSPLLLYQKNRKPVRMAFSRLAEKLKKGTTSTGCASSIETGMRYFYVCLSSFPRKCYIPLLYDPAVSKKDTTGSIGVGEPKQPKHLAMSSAQRQEHSLNEQEGYYSLCMSEISSKGFDVCCDCSKLHVCLVHIRKVLYKLP